MIEIIHGSSSLLIRSINRDGTFCFSRDKLDAIWTSERVCSNKSFLSEIRAEEVEGTRLGARAPLGTLGYEEELRALLFDCEITAKESFEKECFDG